MAADCVIDGARDPDRNSTDPARKGRRAVRFYDDVGPGCRQPGRWPIR